MKDDHLRDRTECVITTNKSRTPQRIGTRSQFIYLFIYLLIQPVTY